MRSCDAIIHGRRPFIVVALCSGSSGAMVWYSIQYMYTHYTSTKSIDMQNAYFFFGGKTTVIRLPKVYDFQIHFSSQLVSRVLVCEQAIFQ